MTPDYIDELVLEAEVTHIGIEPKAVRVAAFQRISGIADAVLAGRYLETAFRRQALRRPHPSEMLQVKRILEGAGLRSVVVQTATGHIGPS